ncbi:MAG: transglutaminase domain-containing protein, partial [Ginsengibacter sp.]
HLNNDKQKIRAAYTWVATNIKYDASHLHRVILDEDKAEKVTWALERKQGVCENFSAIFTDICLKAGLRSYTIEGYTNSDGSIARSGHAWSAVFINDSWYLFDPTWDAGFLKNGTFVSHADTKYFLISPQQFILSHMPFDPLFQFLNYPITFNEFSRGYARSKDQKTYFNYEDSIISYENMQPLARYIAAAQRIEKNGALSEIISTRLKQLRMEKEIIYQDNDVNLYNDAIEDYKGALQNFRNFLTYRNNQFQPQQPIGKTESMLQVILRQIDSAYSKLAVVNQSRATLTLNTGEVEKVLTDLAEKVKDQQVFLKNYTTTAREN